MDPLHLSSNGFPELPISPAQPCDYYTLPLRGRQDGRFALGTRSFPQVSRRRSPSRQLLWWVFLVYPRAPGPGPTLIGRRKQQKSDHGHNQDHEKQEIKPKTFSDPMVVAAMRAIGKLFLRSAPILVFAAGTGEDARSGGRAHQ